ncbi:unnamed protein product [Acanthocheilonema viteae]|uniref:Uncharacterized protein n=1 Tax=Acanthocheilonema viteae TaxID=6277 RepID=A0A498S7F0_ACAVI|nr:unnamed protein product [Acanthocheilonema viteae]
MLVVLDDTCLEMWCVVNKIGMARMVPERRMRKGGQIIDIIDELWVGSSIGGQKVIGRSRVGAQWSVSLFPDVDVLVSVHRVMIVRGKGNGFGWVKSTTQLRRNPVHMKKSPGKGGDVSYCCLPEKEGLFSLAFVPSARSPCLSPVCRSYLWNEQRHECPFVSSRHYSEDVCQCGALPVESTLPFWRHLAAALVGRQT